MQFDFLAVLVVFVFKLVVTLLLVVQRSEAFLPMCFYLCLHLGWNSRGFGFKITEEKFL